MLARPVPPRAIAPSLGMALACAAFAFVLAGCTTVPAPLGGGSDTEAADAAEIARRVAALSPADVLLVGEQHDAPAHHRAERQVVEALAARAQLAALAIEMAEEGRDTASLADSAASATEEQVRTALHWDDKAWPWSDYGPAVMAAVRAGVPVIGANLPRTRMKTAMADVSLDAQLSQASRLAQEEAVRSGHCGLLPETQIAPMTRIQVARDRAMAQAIVKARRPGKTVLLIAGSGHTDRSLGVPQHLPSDLKARSVRLLAAAPAAGVPEGHDVTWRTPPLPEKDYCAGVRSPG